MKKHFEQVLFDMDSSVGVELVVDPAIGHAFHFHPEVELTFVERGEGLCFVGGQAGEFRGGDLFLLGPLLPHLFTAYHPAGRGATKAGRRDGLACVKVVKFASSFGFEGKNRPPEFSALDALLADGAGGVHFSRETAGAAAPNIARLFALTGLRRWTALVDLLDELARGAYGRLGAGDGGGNADARIQRILRYIDACLERGATPSLREAAAFAHLSPTSFSRYFRQRTRKTFVRHVTERKIGRALHLLRETDRPIIEIAYRSGFDNLANFNRRFRQVARMTPRDFRALCHAPMAGRPST